MAAWSEAEILGGLTPNRWFKSRLRHVSLPLLFCVVLSCVGRVYHVSKN
jgi:hypothetical protein